MSRRQQNLRVRKYICFVMMAFSSVFSAVAQTDSIGLVPHPEFKQFNTDLINLVPDDGEIRAGLLYDVKRDKIVWQKDMDNAFPIASLTKMMVGLLAVEDVEAGKVQMSDVISITNTYKKRIKRRKYKTYTVSEQYLLNDLLKMALVRSHNESTVWIANHCSPTTAEFIERMNQRAVDLGMTMTHYNNTSGLPSPGVDNGASSRDLLILALECLKHPLLMEITAMPNATVSNGKGLINYRNHNGLTINYTGEVDGIKTGYTKAAGFCMVATSGRAEHRMISVILGVRSPWVRNGIVANMMNSYYDAIHLGRLGESAPDLVASQLFMDSVSRGLAFVIPKVEKHESREDVSYAYTYKTVTEKVKKSYTVRSGDNLSKIADRLNVSLADLRKWNKIKSSKVIKGQKLVAYTTVKKRVPVKLEVIPCEDMVADADNDSCVDPSTMSPDQLAVEETDDLTPPAKTKVKNAVAVVKPVAKTKVDAEKYALPKVVYHKVQHGDTLWNIAQRYNTTIQEIKKVNGINGSQIKVGSRLKVPVSS
ncbi:MAG: LysM peptidoglycan-binding domain-containing protein [Bacteroidota bacterium]